jgi:hypothetical protein
MGGGARQGTALAQTRDGLLHREKNLVSWFVRVHDPSLLVLQISYMQIGMGDCDAIL